MDFLKKISAAAFGAMLLTSLSACYSDIDIETNTKPVLCLNAQITAGQPVEVEVTHTWLYSDPTGQFNNTVDDATVTVLVNDIEAAPDYIARSGDNITIIADSPKYGTAQGSVTVPHPAPIEQVRFTPVLTSLWCYEDDIRTLFDIGAEFHILLTIADTPGTENYYHYQCTATTAFVNNNYDDEGNYDPTAPSVYVNCGTLQYEAEPIFSEHIGIFESVTGSDAEGFTFFTDRQFTDGTYTLNLNYTNAYVRINVSPDQFDTASDCNLVLQLSTVSKSLYNFANYNWQIESGLIGDLSSVGLRDPIGAYSNVSTHAGIIAARATATHTISLKNFIADALQQASQTTPTDK